MSEDLHAQRCRNAALRVLTRPLLGAPAGTVRGRRQRGIALIMVVSAVAILSAVAIDFQYNSDVDLQLAANARDELRAEYLARSSVNLSRLLLRFQKQFDGQAAMNLGPLLQQAGLTGAPQAPGANTPGAGGGGLNIRLWEIVPIDCSLFSMLLGGATEAEDDKSDAPAFGEDEGEALKGLLAKGAKGKVSNFGDFSGCFHADITDEEQKINVNRLNFGSVRGTAAMKQALLLLGDPRFEFLFEKADANGVKMTSAEVLIALHDWIDERDSQATLNITGAGDPFPDGFGDENRNYSRYPVRYKSKNARFDTLDELFQVDGVSDRFMAAFGERLTVYPDINRLLNINTNDPIQQYVNIATVAANENDPKLKNPLVIGAILQEIGWVKMFSFMAMSAMQFVNIVERNGIAIRADIKAGGVANNNFITDRSETFTVKAAGQAGNVEKTITAVIRYNDGLGKVLYYRED